MPTPAKPKWINALAVIAIAFGTLTVFSGASILFFDGAARAAAGNYVPFVLWFNFLAGFAYIIAGIGLFLWRGWAVKLALLLALATLVVFAAFAIATLIGTPYEIRTFAAMVLRSTVWVLIAAFTARAWNTPAPA
jgi:hypothetical protein